jgi:hypothetical protein
VNVALIFPQHVVRAWQDLGPMLARAEREGSAREAVMEGTAQLWAVIDRYEPIGAVVTRVDAETGRCLLWQIAGSRVREWAALFVATVAEWARGLGCTVLYGCGRKGWARIVEPLGFVRVADIDGRPAWEWRIA